MVSLKPHLCSLLESLPSSPISKERLDNLVRKALDESKNTCAAEISKTQWEYLLKDNILTLAATEGTALKTNPEEYYTRLQDYLELVLVFTEHVDACEQTFPFTVLQDLLEVQTIASCSKIFSWIELRASRLTEGMVPQKGKALILLRTLNDLLRRLSKMGNNTIFCGRILTFLSGVFPLGERSGVNLRGEYGPMWERVSSVGRTAAQESDIEMKLDSEQKQDTSDAVQTDKMQVDPPKVPTPTTEERKEEFYNIFWSLQLPFSRPPLFAQPQTYQEFKDAVIKVLPIIKEATAKERAMMGSRSSSSGTNGLKRKREPEEGTNNNDYFFAKFLTSPDLLDLEIADTHFRRQFLFQLLILLNHLLNFTKAAKATWHTPRNRSLQIEFTLEEDEAQWVQEIVVKVMEELRQTTPNGRTFADTVNAVLERDKNWVRWKNELCTPFDKEPWAEEVNGEQVGLLAATKPIRDKLREPPADWKWSHGTAALSEIWSLGFRDLRDLENVPSSGSVQTFLKKSQLEDRRIALREQFLEKTRVKAAAAAAETPVVPAPAALPEVSKPEGTTTTTLAAPKPLPIGHSPLHPSLPPKPGTPSKLASSSQESPKPANVPANPVVPTGPSTSGTPVPPPAATPVDPIIAAHEENKHRWAWLALRTARDQYIQHFGKIGTGDLVKLAHEIEQEKNGVKDNDGVDLPMGDENGCASPSIAPENAEDKMAE
ncbi:hypothetical protein CVT24_001786 [Panaeolus cyanescens]|uniref:THO complex subunit 1 n=1 Tax=Panaeolus cyanescens TaxID=181874 RepID=A0A409YUA0_9AGAR|nr:hypothetical protein CVT24_001786 [Panaeolus cyanescens]